MAHREGHRESGNGREEQSLRRGKSITLLHVGTKASLNPGDTEHPIQYSAYVALRVASGAILRWRATSAVSQAVAFEHALRSILQAYDPTAVALELSPFSVKLVDPQEGQRSGFESRVAVYARVTHGSWSFEGTVEHTDTGTAICFLLFDAYDDHYSHRERVRVRGTEREAIAPRAPSAQSATP